MNMTLTQIQKTIELVEAEGNTIIELTPKQIAELIHNIKSEYDVLVDASYKLLTLAFPYSII
jgi:hypothetical protein